MATIYGDIILKSKRKYSTENNRAFLFRTFLCFVYVADADMYVSLKYEDTALNQILIKPV